MYKSKTKGRFAEVPIASPETNFNRDKDWLNKANPAARKAEKDFLDKDRHLLEKRRY